MLEHVTKINKETYNRIVQFVSFLCYVSRDHLSHSSSFDFPCSASSTEKLQVQISLLSYNYLYVMRLRNTIKSPMSRNAFLGYIIAFKH